MEEGFPYKIFVVRVPSDRNCLYLFSFHSVCLWHHANMMAETTIVVLASSCSFFGPFMRMLDKFLAHSLFFWLTFFWHIYLETRAVPFPLNSTEVELVGDPYCAASAQRRLTVNSGLPGLDLKIIAL